jgi:hypothetical protein
MSANTVTRGYVIVRSDGRVSGIVPKSQAERMARRFGGRVVDVAGESFRLVRGARVLVDPTRIA